MYTYAVMVFLLWSTSIMFFKSIPHLFRSRETHQKKLFLDVAPTIEDCEDSEEQEDVVPAQQEVVGIQFCEETSRHNSKNEKIEWEPGYQIHSPPHPQPVTRQTKKIFYILQQPKIFQTCCTLRILLQTYPELLHSSQAVSSLQCHLSQRTIHPSIPSPSVWYQRAGDRHQRIGSIWRWTSWSSLSWKTLVWSEMTTKLCSNFSSPPSLTGHRETWETWTNKLKWRPLIAAAGCVCKKCCSSQSCPDTCSHLSSLIRLSTINIIHCILQRGKRYFNAKSSIKVWTFSTTKKWKDKSQALIAEPAPQFSHINI